MNFSNFYEIIKILYFIKSMKGTSLSSQEEIFVPVMIQLVEIYHCMITDFIQRAFEKVLLFFCDSCLGIYVGGWAAGICLDVG